MTCTPAVNLMADAKDYAARGFSYIPVDANKKPTVRWDMFTKRRPTDAEQRNWFNPPNEKMKVAGIAVIAGVVSDGLAIRDFDQQASYDRWAETNPTLSRELPTSITHRGRHVLHRSNVNRIIKLEDGEYRGAGITVAPHSLHPSGHRYDWVIPLPKGRLPEVDPAVFGTTETGNMADAFNAELEQIDAGNVTESTEYTESHFSAVSVVSVTSGALTPLSVFSVLSVTSAEKAIEVTQPTQPGQRNSCILNLARALRHNLRIESGQLRGIVRRWHELALPVITTKSFDETWSDFIHAYERAKYPLGANIIGRAGEQAASTRLPDVAGNYDSKQVRHLIGLCFQLSNMNKGKFFLSVHVAAERIGVTPMQCWRFIKMLVRDGVIQVMEPGSERKATRYRWTGGGK